MMVCGRRCETTLSFPLQTQPITSTTHSATCITQRVLDAWRAHDCIVILGDNGEFPHGRIGIVSIAIREPVGPAADPADALFFHHHFLAALINDLLGIQARSGCACAGPYGWQLLGLQTMKDVRVMGAFVCVCVCVRVCVRACVCVCVCVQHIDVARCLQVRSQA